MKKKIFCFDLDNTICKTVGKKYYSAIPNKHVIKFINKLYNNGHCIKVFTSRFMGRNKESKIKAKKQGFKKTQLQLKRWGLKYNILLMGKPSYDIFIDDKAYGFNKNWLIYYNKYTKKNFF